MVSLTRQGLKTSLYRKPTDRPTYLNYSSFHPPHTKRSIVFSQLLRFKRICSDNADYEKAVRHLVQSLLECGYPYKLILKEINRASYLSRDTLLSQKRNSTTAQSQRIPFVTRFSPTTTPFLQKVKCDWRTLKSNPSLPPPFSCPPVLAKKQPPNLHRLLVCTKPRPPPGNTPCRRPRCQICDHFNINPSVEFQNNVTLYPVRAGCNTPNIVYILYCSKCPEAIYVGETANRFRTRFNNHKHSIRNNLPGFPVASHFNAHNHFPRDLRCIIIRDKFPNTDSRKLYEQQLILKLNSHTTGLNKDLAFLSHYSISK